MTNEEQAKTMKKTLPNQSGTFSNRTHFCMSDTGQKIFTIEFEDDVTNEDRLLIIENVSALPDIKEQNNQQQAEIDRLQAKITEFAGMLLDYETKFDILAENEAKRCIEFGEVIRNNVDIEIDTIRIIACESKSHSGDYADNLLYQLQESIRLIDIKQLYTNFKKP